MTAFTETAIAEYALDHTTLHAGFDIHDCIIDIFFINTRYGGGEMILLCNHWHGNMFSGFKGVSLKKMCVRMVERSHLVRHRVSLVLSLLSLIDIGSTI